MKHRFLLALFLFFAPLCAQSQHGDDSIDDSISQNPEFLVPDYEWLGRTINDPSSPFFYPTLLKRFAEADTSLSIE